MSKFENMLTDLNYPSVEQRKKELWNIEGIIKNKSNQKFKFDTRPILKLKDGQVGKKGSFFTKAEKVVFEYKNEWVIVDIEELHTYIKENKKTILEIKEILNNLDWNIILKK